jgi:arylsulfate sulfotransferase
LDCRALFPLLLASCLHAQISLSLRASTPSPAPLGKMITWTATASGAGPGTLWYRFRARLIGRDFRTVKDFGPDNSFDWTATDHEGTFEIEATTRNLASGASSAAKAQYEMLSNVTGRVPVVKATSHPLVFLYSAPPCAAESRMRVRFETNGGPAQHTPWKRCQSGKSMNFYLAGLRTQTRYTATHIVDTGSSFHSGPAIGFTTGKEIILPASQTVVQPAEDGGILLQSAIVKNVIATDLGGNLLWYYAQPVMLMTDPESDGYFWAIIGGGDLSHQTIRKFDVAGMTLTETNVARINEQLAALGKSPITGFHHEACRLPDGRILALGTEERILTDVQGPGPVDVIGDMVIVINADLQVLWTWDAFEHLDVKRKATLNETCTSCATLAPRANDWTHLNSAEQTPDGNLLISARNQDFIYKIAYENGNGDGHVIWRLGQGGDFQLNSPEWFSHQHDARYTYDGDTITLYDDGNLRHAIDPTAHSRGQALRIDEQNMTADLILNADLGVFSSALGSAQRLPNGHYMFLSGFLSDNTSLIAEVDPSGRIVYQLHTGAQQYRTFRMRDLFTAPR